MSSDDSPGAVIWDRGRRALTVGLLLTVSSAAFEALAVATVLPATVAEIGGVELYGWAFSGFMLTNLVSIILAGQVADRRGPALPFAVGSVLFATGLVMAGLAPSMLIVVAGRALQGLGAGALSSVAYVAVARAYPGRAQPRMLAMLSSAWVVPGLIGPAMAGTIADHLSWRWVFLGLAPLMVGASALAIPALQRLGRVAGERAESSRTIAALRLAAGASAVLLGASAGSGVAVAGFMVVGLVVALPALRSLTPPGTLRARPGQPAAVATMALLSFAFFGAEAFLPLALTSVRGQSTTMAGGVLTAAALAWTTGAWIQARFESRRSRRALTTTGLLIMLLGIAGTLAVFAPEVPASVVVLSWGTAGLGIGIAYSTTTLVVLESAAPGREGAASAAVQLANVLGVALGTGLGGALLAVATAAHRSQSAGIVMIDGGAALAAVLAVVAARGIRAQG